MSSPACDEQCQKEDFGMTAKFCLYINCRLNCFKEITEKECPNNGHAAVTKVVKKLATLAKIAYGQRSPPQEIPEECKPDNIVQGA